MLTLLRTLARGAAAQACEEAHDRHALLVLDQQIRETAADLERGRRMVNRLEDARTERLLMSVGKE